jgi:hypothetical protein
LTEGLNRLKPRRKQTRVSRRGITHREDEKRGTRIAGTSEITTEHGALFKQLQARGSKRKALLQDRNKEEKQAEPELNSRMNQRKGFGIDGGFLFTANIKRKEGKKEEKKKEEIEDQRRQKKGKV